MNNVVQLDCSKRIVIRVIHLMDSHTRITNSDYELERQIANECGVDYTTVLCVSGLSIVGGK